MNTKDIYEAVRPIIISTALFGLSSIFTTKRNENRKYKTYNILKILNVIYITAYTFLLYLAVDNLLNENEFQPNYASGVAKIGIVFQILAQICLTYTIYLFNISKSDQILSIIHDINKVDTVFGDLGETLNYRKHFWVEICIISIGFVVICGRALIAHIYTGNNVVAKENGTHFVFFFPAFVSFLLQNYFVLPIFLVYERFVLTNKLLDNFIEAKEIQTAWKIKPQEYQLKHTIKRIELLMEIHDHLTDVGNKVNDTFTIQILCCLTAQFLTEVFTVFYVYYESLILKNKTAAVVWMIWTLCTTLEIFYITITCHLTAKEVFQAQNSGVVIHKVLLNELEADVKRKFMIFSQQVSQRPLQFTACGLFTIDATLIFTIAGAAATYLLIMLQFQEGVEAQCSSNSTIG